MIEKVSVEIKLSLNLYHLAPGVMESKATFKERALDIGLEAALVTELIAKGVDRFSRLAYVCPANPTSGDDTKLKRALEDLLEHELQPVAMIGIRQLWFESYTLAMTELEDRVKKSPTDIPKSLPLAERMARIERQRTKLVGLIYDQHTEPAHCLTDKAHSMLEDGVITYMPPSKCPSRHDEIQGNKSEQSVTFDTQASHGRPVVGRLLLQHVAHLEYPVRALTTFLCQRSGPAVLGHICVQLEAASSLLEKVGCATSQDNQKSINQPDPSQGSSW